MGSDEPFNIKRKQILSRFFYLFLEIEAKSLKLVILSLKLLYFKFKEINKPQT